MSIMAMVAATAFGASRPTVGLTVTVSGDDATVAVTVNRGTQQLRSCTYRMDGGSSVSCGAPARLGSKSSRYTAGLTDLSVGSHSVTVAVTLTDGGTATGSTTFSVAEPRMFAVAYRNLDGVAGYSPADRLYARLMDTNRNDEIDGGDTIEVNVYPTDFSGSATATSSVGVARHTVEALSAWGSDRVVVTTTADDSFVWGVSPSQPVYSERTGDFAAGSSFTDNRSFAACDRIRLDPSSPSRPTSAVVLDESAPCGSTGWLTVQIASPF
jgi:hypothetical protein